MKTRRSVRLIPPISPLELRNIILRLNRPRDRCLIALLYLSGRRIGEILPLQKRDFDFSQSGFLSFRTFNEKTFRVNKTRDYRYERVNPNKANRVLHPIVYYQEIYPKFALDSPSGKALAEFVLDYLATLRDEDYLFAPERVFYDRKYINIHRAYQILREADERLWLHALRHLRFTAYGRAYRDDPLAMHPLTFHRRFESTLTYIRPAQTDERLRQI